jgi:murein DD-endopeptidase MepM/ murein hydrolase activator NlpD
MKTYLLLALFSIQSIYLFGQQDIEVTAETKPDQSVVFWCKNNTSAGYHVSLEFPRLTNASISSPINKNVPPGISQMALLRPINNNSGVGYQYKYKYFRGYINPKIKEDQVYLLPVKTGNTTIISTAQLSNYFGKKTKENFYAMCFSAEDGDTVYASRTGTISRIGVEDNVSNHPLFKEYRTEFIEFFHADGTFTKYFWLEKDSGFVKIGQKIIAGDPIGIVSHSGPQKQIGLTAYYLDKDLIWSNDYVVYNEFACYKPKFIFNDMQTGYLEPKTSYVAVKPDHIITCELSKSEVKKRLKKNLLTEK